MKIPDEGVEEYRRLVKKKYSLEITQAQAKQGFRDLLSLFQVIYRPMNDFDRSDSSSYNQDGETNEKRQVFCLLPKILRRGR